MVKRVINALIRRCILIVGLFIPIKKNRILCSSYFGRGYSDNLKYICDELLDENVEIFWIVKNDSEAKTLPDKIKPVKYGSFKSLYYIITSGIWLNNCRFDFFYKKKEQFYIQTWHGGAQKKIEADVEDKLPEWYVEMAKKDAKHTDLMISESSFMTKLYQDSFWYNGPVYECGYPRYDILMKDNLSIKTKVYEYYGLTLEKEIVLYAPTFRSDHSFDAYNIDFDRLLDALKKRFNKEFVVLVHLHPNVANIEGVIAYNEKVINSTFYPDTQELLASSAVLIGDYSSINYDFSITGKPVFRYANDLEKYKQDRDLYFDFGDYPFPFATNNDDLIKIVCNFDSEEYNRDLQYFFNQIGVIKNPNSSKDIAKLILDISKYKKDDFIEKYRTKFVYKHGNNK